MVEATPALKAKTPQSKSSGTQQRFTPTGSSGSIPLSPTGSQTSSSNVGSNAAAKADNHDHLNVETDNEIKSQFINPEMEVVVMFSCRLRKVNKYGIKQERNFVVTNVNIYNFKQKRLRRVMAIKNLGGLTKSLKQNSSEFIVHVKKEYDYRLLSSHRETIFQIVKMAYLSQVQDNLPIYGIAKSRSLMDFCTSEKDVDRGISRMPLVLARIYEEDIKFDASTKKTRTQLRPSPISAARQDEEEADRLMANLTEIAAKRNDCHRRSVNNLKEALAQRRESKPLDAELPFDEQSTQANESDQGTVLYRRETVRESRWDDFELLSMIGKGTFGKVYLVRNNLCGKHYAMKTVRKDVVIKHESVESLQVEKMILNQVNHPFIIGMDYVFQKAYRIYFIMEFVQGGELFKHLSEQKRFSEEKTKFYAAQISLALGYLHESNIIYRDLKPENILINDDGYIMLADFGLAKIMQEDTEEPNSFCGTPEYLSPEMIVGSGHDKTLDWWALGILIYEMIIGIPPFYNPNKNQMYQLIQSAPIRWPEQDKHGIEVSANAKDLISKMLCKDRRNRLGQNNDVDEILLHPFFADLDMGKLLNKKLPAPFVPSIVDQNDLRHFDQDILTSALAESHVPEQSAMEINQQAKKGAFDNFGPVVGTGQINSPTGPYETGSSESSPAVIRPDRGEEEKKQ